MIPAVCCLCAAGRSLGSGANCRPPRALSPHWPSVILFSGLETQPSPGQPEPATDSQLSHDLHLDFCSPSDNHQPQLLCNGIASSSIAGGKGPGTRWRPRFLNIITATEAGRRAHIAYAASLLRRLLVCLCSCRASCSNPTRQQQIKTTPGLPGLPGLPPFPATLRNTTPTHHPRRPPPSTRNRDHPICAPLGASPLRAISPGRGCAAGQGLSFV